MSESARQAPPSLVPEVGWHVLHLFYRIDRERLARLTPALRAEGRRQFAETMRIAPAGEAQRAGGPKQLQTLAVVGHKADFGVILAGPDLRGVSAVQQGLQASALGTVLEPMYSFASLTEVSEYVPTLEDHARRLREEEGLSPESEVYRVKVEALRARQDQIQNIRLYPEFPNWPAICFYPMNKRRGEHTNWYALHYDARRNLMASHGRTGGEFSGRVSQLITSSTGLDDWEWGVTLWARNPAYLKELVYTIRFDPSSALYAEFGPFYYGFVLPAEELLDHLHL